ncbi:MAG: BatD family protein [Prevotella sp.]|nr:BatD family protein [Prevotella sp.]
MRKVLAFLVYIAYASFAYGQKFVAEAPSDVSVGEQFRLTYTISTQDVAGFTVGSIPDAFEVLIGPTQSFQSSFQSINGHTTSSRTITYTYVLYANKKGSFTIPAASIYVGKKKLTSNSVRVNVGGGASGNSSRQGAPRSHSSSRRISGSDLFIKVSASKSRVHEQEPILLTYKVYTLVDLTQLTGKMPDLKGFHTQEIQLPQQKNFKIETFNGRPYKTVTWSQYVMFPQMTGKLEIPSITFNGVVALQDRSVDPFEAFFNGGSGYVEVKHSLKAPGVSLQVDPLPARPAGFSGGVGVLDMSATVSASSVKTNEPVTIRVTVSGTGNLKLIKAPVVKFPKDFDTYDVKTTDKTKLTVNGVEGSVVYEYLAVPRNQGQFKIPAVEFIYYDVKTDSYRTLKSDAFTLDVDKNPKDASAGGGAGVGTGIQQDMDIRDIRYDSVDTGDGIGWWSTEYKMTMGLFVLLFIALAVARRYVGRVGADDEGSKMRKANKVATKRLKKAKKLMLENKQDEFYDEVLRALWGYIGNKLNISVEQISRDNISQKLSEKNVGEGIISEFIGALDECEFARYAPGDAKGNMTKTFDTAMGVITKIEEEMKKNSSRRNLMVLIAVFLMMCIAPGSLHAVTKEDADRAYNQKQYHQAIKSYESLLRSGGSVDLYYNLGNAYYRTGNISRAIINYERALLLDQGDEDVRHNLKIANSKTVDKIVPRSRVFFVEWYNSLRNCIGIDKWINLGFISLALIFVFAVFYLFPKRVLIQKIGFFGSLFFAVIFLFSTLFAYEQNQKLISHSEAVIVSPIVLIKKSPSSGGMDLFILHEGAKVEILDGVLMDWKEIRLPDGRKGWVESSHIERI